MPSTEPTRSALRPTSPLVSEEKRISSATPRLFRTATDAAIIRILRKGIMSPIHRMNTQAMHGHPTTLLVTFSFVASAGQGLARGNIMNYHSCFLIIPRGLGATPATLHMLPSPLNPTPWSFIYPPTIPTLTHSHSHAAYPPALTRSTAYTCISIAKTRLAEFRNQGQLTHRTISEGPLTKAILP